MTTKTTFKAGDRVYAPFYTNKVCVVAEATKQHDELVLEVRIDKEMALHNKKTVVFVNKYGCLHEDSPIKRVLFHATYQNRTLLEALYDMEFETPSTYIQATVRIPKPHTGEIKRGEPIYIVDIASVDKVTHFVWDDLENRRYLRDTGQIYLNEKDAIDAVNAILKVLGGNDE